jgi:subtilase family serine protease
MSRNAVERVILALVVVVMIVPALPGTSAGVGTASRFLASVTEILPASLIVSRTAAGPTCGPSGLCPQTLDTAYGFSTLQSNGTTGKNQTIIIDDACGDPTIRSDLKAFDTQFSLPAPTLKVMAPQGTPCTDGSWATETALDVEWAHATAPGAAIDLIEAAVPNTTDVYGVWSHVINDHLGNQISDSWGGAGCYSQPTCNATIGQGIGSCDSVAGTAGVNVTAILNRATRAGITVLASAGDSGAWGQGTTSTLPMPADCASVLTVGGTTLKVTSSGSYIKETAWAGTGGGYTNQSEPRYQSSVKITDTYRTLAKPDVAADANPSTGVWIYNQGWGVVGGTSVSSPLWAGFMADVNEIRADSGLGPAGFVNSFLYETVYGVRGISANYATDFHDILSGNNGWPAKAGWDADTGLGSFNVTSLAATLGTNSTA